MYLFQFHFIHTYVSNIISTNWKAKRHSCISSDSSFIYLFVLYECKYLIEINNNNSGLFRFLDFLTLPWSIQEWFCTNSCYVIYAILIPSYLNSKQVASIFLCFQASLLSCHKHWSKTSPDPNVEPPYYQRYIRS